MAYALPPPSEAPTPELLYLGGINIGGRLDGDVPGRAVIGMVEGPYHVLCKQDESPDPSVYTWCPVAVLPNSMHHHEVVALNEHVYVIGGAVHNPREPQKLGVATAQVLIFSPVTCGWWRGPDMRNPRAYFGATVADGAVWVVGGEDHQRTPMMSVDRLEASAPSWDHVTDLPGPGRLGAAVAAFKGKIYVLGGFSKTEGYLNRVDVFDISRGQWASHQPLSQARAHASAIVTAEGRLLLIGGWAISLSLSDIELYDEKTDGWITVAKMRRPRHDVGTAIIGSSLYIVGGLCPAPPPALGPMSMPAVDVLDTVTWTWRPPSVTPELPFPAAGGALVAVNTGKRYHETV